MLTSTLLPRLFCVALLAQTSVITAELPPRFFGCKPGSLMKAKERLAAGDKALAPALKKLIKDADKALKETPPSVMEKAKLPPSHDKHDYISLAPYFWPDPKKRNGLPYIRKDGKVNPDSKDPDVNDAPRLTVMGKSVETLALAYYFTGKQEYATQAAKFVRTWFLDPATKMNPHLNFGQAVMGDNTGRGEGILEARFIAVAADAVGLLAGSEAWKPMDQQELDKWLNSFVRWLMTSPNGRDEHGAKNNHGSWFDAQTARLALCLNRRDMAAKIAKDAMHSRIPVQIEKDGRQPLELARTASFSYCWFNLEALSELATAAEYAGVDLWHYTASNGRGLHSAMQFMLPFVDVPAKEWPYEQIKEIKEESYLPLLRQAALAFSASEFEDVLSKHPDAEDDRFQLLFLK